MTREQKAVALQAIQDGRLKPSDLLEPGNHIFRQSGDGYLWRGQTITPDLYRELITGFRAENARRVASGLPVATVIVVTYGNRKAGR